MYLRWSGSWARERGMGLESSAVTIALDRRIQGRRALAA